LVTSSLAIDDHYDYESTILAMETDSTALHTRISSTSVPLPQNLVQFSSALSG